MKMVLLPGRMAFLLIFQSIKHRVDVAVVHCSMPHCDLYVFMCVVFCCCCVVLCECMCLSVLLFV